MDDDSPRDRAPDWRGRLRADAANRPAAWHLFGTSSQPTQWLLNLALLVVLCVVVMAIATAVLRHWRPIAVAPAGAVTVPVNAERAAAERQFTVTAGLERQASLKAQQEADARRQAAIKQREAEEEAARRTAALEARREREWQAYYKKPAYCNAAVPDIDSVGCANDYIRARRQFDAQFSASGRR